MMNSQNNSNILQSNILYSVFSQEGISTLESSLNINELNEMRKAHVSLMDQSGFEEKLFSNHIVQLADDATDDDLLDIIDQMERKTGRICSDWSWVDLDHGSASIEEITSDEDRTSTNGYSFKHALKAIH